MVSPMVSLPVVREANGKTDVFQLHRASARLNLVGLENIWALPRPARKGDQQVWCLEPGCLKNTALEGGSNEKGAFGKCRHSYKTFLAMSARKVFHRQGEEKKERGFWRGPFSWQCSQRESWGETFASLSLVVPPTPNTHFFQGMMSALY